MVGMSDSNCKSNNEDEDHRLMDFYGESEDDDEEFDEALDKLDFCDMVHTSKLTRNGGILQYDNENEVNVVTFGDLSEIAYSDNSTSLSNHGYDGKIDNYRNNDCHPSTHLSNKTVNPFSNNNTMKDNYNVYGDDNKSYDDHSFATTSNGERNDEFDLETSSSEAPYNDNNRHQESNVWDKEYKQVREYAKSETRIVHRVRYIVFGTLVVVGSIVSFVTFRLLHKESESKHHEAYLAFARKIEDSFRLRVLAILEAHRELSRSITLASLMETSMEKNWSFASTNTVQPSWRGGHNFETSASNARKRAGIEFFCYAPIVVGTSNISAWINYTTTTSSIRSQDWYEQSKVLYDALHHGSNRSSEPPRTNLDPILWKYKPIDNSSQSAGIQSLSLEAWDFTNLDENQVFVPRYVTSPPPSLQVVDIDGVEKVAVIQNEDMFSDNETRELSLASIDVRDVVFSKFSLPIISSLLHKTSEMCSDSENTFNTVIEGCGRTLAVIPVYETLQPLTKDHFNMNGLGHEIRDVGDHSPIVVGYIYSIVSWEKYLLGLLPQGINGVNVRFVGTTPIDSTNKEFDFRSIDFTALYDNTTHAHSSHSACSITLVVYHTQQFEDLYKSILPIGITALIAILFTIVVGVFFVYEYLVKSRDEKVDHAAAQSNAIVSSLFPSNVRDRLLAEHHDSSHNGDGKKSTFNDINNKRKSKSSLKRFLDGEIQDTEMLDSDLYKTKPIADLFPETTVMFGDIVGFTAWSSVREPSQVFTLLETLYRSFDEIANRRRVFKVETVGDCYVAVCGLPDPRKDHAVNMARFARDCLYRMWTLTTKLEITLGPETADLAMRVGLHSGPVTAGVLRGERARFQLFGDTMNTAARMESNGAKDRIHFSQETADLLVAGGKSSWIIKRESKITAKGKGELQTYWLTLVDRSDRSFGHTADISVGTVDCELQRQTQAGTTSDSLHGTIDVKHVRMIEWNVEVLHRSLKQIVAKRQFDGRQLQKTDDLVMNIEPGQTVLDEVKEIITLPQRQSSPDKYDANDVQLDPFVIEELTDYVTLISTMYREHPFHNFEHASHVTMSVSKLLSRIVAPSDHAVEKISDNFFSLHDHTYGITSDPLTQFACVFSALIHDLDHPGVPNSQLVKENSELACLYKNKSTAEQHSVDLAWHILMSGKYSNLRSTIYCDEIEMKRFRQLVVNSVMATDIVDKELKALRNSRWEKAFSTTINKENIDDTINRKATIVIEHLIQASDVAHTMQHWHVYRKWNGRFFLECYAAYMQGRADVDPSINWYKGEIDFFDFYIIPLAKKLKDCGVFGVSSDEYLNYALKNREEWEQRGQEVLDELIARVKKLYDS